MDGSVTLGALFVNLCLNIVLTFFSLFFPFPSMSISIYTEQKSCFSRAQSISRHQDTSITFAPKLVYRDNVCQHAHMLVDEIGF